MMKYLRSIFDSTSPTSFGRHACAIVLLWIMFSATWVMIDDSTNKRDLFVPDVPTQWVMIILGLFGIAAGKDAINIYSNKTQTKEVTNADISDSK